MRTDNKALIRELVDVIRELYLAYDCARAQQEGGDLLTRAWDLMRKAKQSCER
jgi:hypothetical protein